MSDSLSISSPRRFEFTLFARIGMFFSAFPAAFSISSALEQGRKPDQWALKALDITLDDIGANSAR